MSSGLRRLGQSEKMPTMDAAPYDLDALRAHFEAEGYVYLPRLFSEAEISTIRASFDALAAMARGLVDPGADPSAPAAIMHQGSQFVLSPDPDRAVRIHRVVWCGAAAPALSALGGADRLVQIACALMGVGAVDQLINQAHFKQPGDAVAFRWHQDSVHRRYGTDLWTDVTGRGSFVEIAAAVDAMTPENGPLQIIPRSHLGGHQTPAGAKHLDLTEAQRAAAIPVTLRPGDAVAFGPYLIHGSAANTGPHDRRLLLNGFAAPGANRRIYPGEGAGRRLSASPASP